MKILWFCNIALPEIAEIMSIPVNSGGGWLEGAMKAVVKDETVSLTISFPSIYTKSIHYEKLINISYFAYPQKKKQIHIYDMECEKFIEQIISETVPDIIHIWGTEFPHTLSIVKSAIKLGYKNKILISIQGLISFCALHYVNSLPLYAIHRCTIRDFLRYDSIFMQMKKYYIRGQYEKKALLMVNNAIGRTTWDFACVRQINDSIKYYSCNETLREIFYKNEWKYDSCEKGSLLITQASYPLKGLHNVLDVLPLVIRKHPEIHLYIAGNDITKVFLKKTYYGKYILKKIHKHHLENHVTFLGNLDDIKICERFLKTNIYILPSSIENSPNSLGEATLLGVPSIASDVGGVKDLITHNEEGYLYPFNEPYMLAHYILDLLESPEKMLDFSRKARNHALTLYNREANYRALLGIYDDMLK